MRLLVVGATGSLGRLAVAEAAQRGHDVTAVVRDPARANLPEPVVKVRGDVLPVSLGPAVEGRDAVVCALGTPSPRQASSLLEDGTRNLVAAMERAGVPRLVCVTLLGTADSKRNASPLYRYIILRALAPMVPDKENQERVVRDSGLECVLIRPPRFTSQRRGQLRVLRPGDKGRVGHVSRHDLARVLIDAAERPDYLHQAIVVGS
jgi:putative NADH-flavin reductase